MLVLRCCYLMLHSVPRLAASWAQCHFSAKLFIKGLHRPAHRFCVSAPILATVAKEPHILLEEVERRPRLSLLPEFVDDAVLAKETPTRIKQVRLQALLLNV